MVDLGTLGGRQSAAMAINDAGVIVGASETSDRQWHAFMHDGKKMIDLGKLVGAGSSFATDINSAGHVVGTVLRGDERLSFVYRNGVMSVHRGGKGLHLTNAINDRELVVGATYNRRMDAATMVSNAVPVVESGGMRKSMYLALFSILVAAATVWIKRRRAAARGPAFPT
jgi:probable HAF family extracellular repeat protein